MQRLNESRIFEFDEFRLDAKRHRLYRRDNGEFIPLANKVVEFLTALVVAKGRLLTKDELLDTVWAGSIVEQANLTQTVFVLRKALGDDTREPRFILTVPGRGYQFICDVAEPNSEDGILDETFLSDPLPVSYENPPLKDRRSKVKLLALAVAAGLTLAAGFYWFFPSSKPASLGEIRSIAILPFDDLSADQTEKYLGISFADALANKFGSLKQITVRPTRTVLKYADSNEEAGKIGSELRVDAVLDGRIQRIDKRIRVSVQLIRTSDNVTIWTENFDDDFTNFFTVQDSISQKVVRSLALQMDDFEAAKFNRRTTSNTEAYQRYLQGRYFWNKRTAEGFQRAIEHFNKSIELDPDFALAHSGLAQTFVLLNLFGTTHDPTAFPMAKVSANRALQLDADLADAHAALAQVKLQYDFDWAGTESEYLRAIDLDGNNAVVRQWYGEFLALMLRTDESIVQMQKASELDPTSLSANNAMALPLLRAGEIERGLAVTEKVLKMDPGFPWALHYRSRGFLLRGDLQNALDCAQKAVGASNQSIYMRSNLAYVLVRVGRKAEARQILADLKKPALSGYVSPYNFAIIHNGLGETSAAIKYLNQALDERDFLIVSLKSDALFRNLHGAPQFKDVLQRANLD